MTLFGSCLHLVQLFAVDAARVCECDIWLAAAAGGARAPHGASVSLLGLREGESMRERERARGSIQTLRGGAGSRPYPVGARRARPMPRRLGQALLGLLRLSGRFQSVGIFAGAGAGPALWLRRRAPFFSRDMCRRWSRARARTHNVVM